MIRIDNDRWHRLPNRRGRQIDLIIINPFDASLPKPIRERSCVGRETRETNILRGIREVIATSQSKDRHRLEEEVLRRCLVQKVGRDLAVIRQRRNEHCYHR